MKKNRLAKGAVVLLLAAAIVVAVLGNGKTKRHTAIPTTTSTSTSQLESPTGKPPVTKAGPATPQTKRQPVTVAGLAGRVKSFLAAYYLIKPTDSESTRRTRVENFVSPGRLGYLDLGMSQGTAADQARLAERLTQRGKALAAKLRLGKSPDGKAVRVAWVPVTITLTRPDGSVVSRYRLTVGSRWQYSGKGWKLIGFDKGGGDTG